MKHYKVLMHRDDSILYVWKQPGDQRVNYRFHWTEGSWKGWDDIGAMMLRKGETVEDWIKSTWHYKSFSSLV